MIDDDRFFDRLFRDCYFDPVEFRSALQSLGLFFRNPRRFLWARSLARRLLRDLERDGIPSDSTLEAFKSYFERYEKSRD